MKTQIVIIHGGDTFNTYEEYLSFLREFKVDFERYRTSQKNWKRTLGESLGDQYEVILPDMPNKINAKYVEWKIWFEKFIPHFDERVILIGHSLGGTFLAKYLSEEVFPKKIKAVFLVAACYDDVDSDYSLADFTLTRLVEKFEIQAPRIFLYHSSDDRVVPIVDLEKYHHALPNATVRLFSDRGHFNQESLPELVEDIRSLS